MATVWSLADFDLLTVFFGDAGVDDFIAGGRKLLLALLVEDFVCMIAEDVVELITPVDLESSLTELLLILLV